MLIWIALSSLAMTLIELFRQELHAMKNKIENTNDEIMDTTHPLVEALYRNLEMGMISQK